MPSSRSRLFAAAVLALGGGLLGSTALAIVVAKAVLAAGVPGVVAKPQDVALLGDLLAVSSTTAEALSTVSLML